LRVTLFDYEILKRTSHRPWPMPTSPWIMAQTWHDLLFAHWRVDAQVLAAKVPSAVRVDTFGGDAWLGLVAFHMSNVGPRGIPSLPWLSAFPEVNVRTYVTVAGKPGVYFFSLDASNPLAVGAARLMFGLPYFVASMQLELRTRVHYHSRRRVTSGPPADLVASYTAKGPAVEPRTGSLEYFLTERYCLYTVDHRGIPWRLDIHHPPWPLQSADADIRVNTMTAPIGLDLPGQPPLLHFAKRQDMVAWPMTKAEHRASTERM
jgi:uncharacterized protein